MEKTTCYQCEVEIKVENLEVVHPLCDDCQEEFDGWFQSQLAMFN